jgi:hypothetical membrane protein
LDKRLKEIKPEYLFTTGIGLSLFGVLISFLRVGDFYSVISEFGADTRTATIFNFCLFISGILISIGTILLCKENFKRYGALRCILLLISSASLAFLGLYPLGVSQNIRSVHLLFTAIFFFGFPICMIAFSLTFRKVNKNIGLLLLALGIFDIVQLIALYPNGFKLLSQILGISISLAFIYILVGYSSKMEEVEDEFADLQ